MRAVAAAVLAAAVLAGAVGCGGDDEPEAAASSALATASSAADSALAEASAAAGTALSEASAAADSALSEASAAAASAVSEAGSAAESMASDLTASPSPADAAGATSAAGAAGARAADNTVRVELAGKEPKVYTPQNCSAVPGTEGFGFAGQADGGGQLVITGLGGSKGTITILGGEAGAGNAEVNDFVVNDDGTFSGSATITAGAVKFFGHCDALEK